MTHLKKEKERQHFNDYNVFFMTACSQVCAAKDQWLEDLPPGGWHGGHRRYGERVEQEAARGDGGGDGDGDGGGDSDYVGCDGGDSNDSNCLFQTGRRLEEAANSEVGKELGKVETSHSI